MPSLPDLQPTHRGLSHEAKCGKCLTLSKPIEGTPSDVWATLVVKGWTLCTWGPGSSGYAVCPKCSGKNETTKEGVATASTGKPRKRFV
jgi:hypothetical protein